MSTLIKRKLYPHWLAWTKKRNLPGNPQHLHAANLYILPSAFGWAYGMVILTLLLCAINYQISAVFLLTFLLAITGMISAWQAHANLKGLSISCLTIDDVHQGEKIQVELFINGVDETRYGVQYQIDSQEPMTLEKLAPKGRKLILSLPAERRGCHQPPFIRFSSPFPFGLFKVWGYAFFDQKYYVYPKPLPPGFWPKTWQDDGKNTKSNKGNDDLDNLKPVNNPWIQPNRIAWKIAARGQGWYIKTMNTPEGDYWLFRLEDLPAMDVEQGLQHLTYWLLEAEHQNHIYGLELKGVRSSFSHGASHLQQCLRQLATY